MITIGFKINTLYSIFCPVTSRRSSVSARTEVEERGSSAARDNVCVFQVASRETLSPPFSITPAAPAYKSCKAAEAWTWPLSCVYCKIKSTLSYTFPRPRVFLAHCLIISTGLFSICHLPWLRIFEGKQKNKNMEYCWNESDTGKLKCSVKCCSHTGMCIANLIWTAQAF